MLKLNVFSSYQKEGSSTQVVLWGFLGLAIYAAPNLVFREYLPREDWTTFLKLLPDSVIYSAYLVGSLRYFFILSSILWAFNFLLPLTPIISALSYFILTSLSAERTPYTNHQWNSISVGLLLFSVWYWNSYKEILSAEKFIFVGRKAAGPLWISQTLLVFSAFEYFYSGLSKVLNSGFEWQSGLSLQLWTYIFSTHDSFLRDWILASRAMSSTFQLLVMCTELASVGVIFSSRVRFPIGLMLIFFHLGNEVLFHFGFYGNILVCAYAYLTNPSPPPIVIQSRKVRIGKPI